MLLERKELLDRVKGKFFTVEFFKLDGTLRKLNGRLGVRKYLRGGDKTFSDADYNMITVWDTQKKAYRSFYMTQIKSLKCGNFQYSNVLAGH